ncbi:MAG: insulinase family protein [Saprospiraceae bacterium]|nr:insulinase family protein [Saprospiraceae bacterium]
MSFLNDAGVWARASVCGSSGGRRFGGSRYADRLPIGTLPVLEGFKHETLKEYYNAWYRPELMAVCAVGDFDVDKVEALIKEKFANLTNNPNAPKRQSFDVPDHKGLRVAIASDAEAAQTTIQLNYKHPLSIATTQEDLRKGMVAELFNSMLGTRLDELIQKGGTPFTYAFSFYSNYVRTKNGFQSFAMVNEKGILEGLRLLLIENQRVKLHGFNAGEFERAKKDMMVGMEKAYKERDKTESNRYVMGLVNAYLENEPFSDVAFRFEFYKKYLAGITLAEVNTLGKNGLPKRAIMPVVSFKPRVKTPSNCQPNLKL